MTAEHQKGLAFALARHNANAGTNLSEDEFLQSCVSDLLDKFTSERHTHRVAQGLAAFEAKPAAVQEVILKQLGVE